MGDLELGLARLFRWLVSRKRSPRRCSFCRAPGHNRRTCREFKERGSPRLDAFEEELSFPARGAVQVTLPDDLPQGRIDEAFIPYEKDATISDGKE